MLKVDSKVKHLPSNKWGIIKDIIEEKAGDQVTVLYLVLFCDGIVRYVRPEYVVETP